MFEINENYKIHPDRSSYEEIWGKIIKPEINKYVSTYTGYTKMNSDAKENIWSQYILLNAQCKNHYMKNSSGRLDRHKVASCYLWAICLASPIMYNDSILSDEPGYYFTFNERVALTTAFSILVAYIKTIISNDSSLDNNSRKELLDKFENGLKFPKPPLVNHGDYINNFISEIHYTIEEGNINILAMAHELYLLEIFTRVC